MLRQDQDKKVNEPLQCIAPREAELKYLDEFGREVSEAR